ncbi:UNVERIFIED_CONTAM: hypothetical protein Scaly_2044900 [Sesamum calycinum]|uniref:Uncharacterized protein n=1 Tax=Sesamum calycinum TaxID=2727403 RepID=A0AAW2N3E0_9LAMI
MTNKKPAEDERTSRQRRRGRNKEKLGTRRTWAIREEKGLINALKPLMAGGWKCDNDFWNGHLAHLEVHMQRAFPHCNIKEEPYITSKIHVWKRFLNSCDNDDKKWHVGWDESGCMVTMEDDNA